MNKKYKVLLIVVFALTCLSLAYSQTYENEENLSIEEVQELIRIQRQEIRAAAKSFLVDELPEIAKIDPDRASRELDNFLSLLSTMTDTEIMYLLGHMYAREGEDDRAITMFDSVLRAEANEDARFMLNLALYRRLIGLINEGNNTAASQFLKAIVFDNYNSAPYFPAYLYIYSELAEGTEAKQELRNLVQVYNENRDIVTTRLLPMREQVLGRINGLDLNAFYSNPNQENFNTISGEIDQIITDVSALNNAMISLKGMMYVSEIQSIHEYEVKNLHDLRKLLLDYANAPVQTQEVLVAATGYLDTAKATIALYDRALQAFDGMLQQRYEALINAEKDVDTNRFASDLYLDQVIQADRTISISEETIDEIDAILPEIQNPVDRQELLALRDEAVQRKADLEIRREQYLSQIQNPDEIERTDFVELVNSYRDLLKERNTMGYIVREMENEVYTVIQPEMNNDVQSTIKPQVSSIVNSVADARSRHQIFTRGMNESLLDVDFITLQMSYQELMAEYNLYTKNQSSLPEEERSTLQAKFRQEQLDLIDVINRFLTENPSFASIEQPGGGNLVQAADLYYNLGELQYYAIPQDLTPALASYRRALQLDPRLPNRDLALYNVAFISSELKRAEVDRNRIAYRETETIGSVPPDNALYNEGNFAEALNALNQIVTEYPESVMYEESVYRLGLLYFRFAEDSVSPVQNRNTAITYFDQIIARPDSPLYYDAVYQRGWVRMNSYDQDDLRLAMNDFLELLVAIENGRISNPDLVRDYKADATDNIAYCLIALDGTNFQAQSQGIAEINRIFAGYENQQVVREVIDLATQNKNRMASRLQAADFLRYRVDQFPLALENPTYLDSIPWLYANSTTPLREGESVPQITRAIYHEIANSYNHNSDWYNANKDNNIEPQLVIVDKAFKESGIFLYNDFANRKDRSAMESYIAHMNEYDGFLQLHGENYSKFRTDTDSIFVDFYAILAENTQNPADYLEAITQLRSYNDKYPENSSYFYNEQRSLYYAQRLYEDSVAAINAGDYSPVAGQPADMDEAFNFISEASLRYIATARQERFANQENLERAALLLINLAEIQRERENDAEAVQLYTQALEMEQYLSDQDKKDVYIRLAVLSNAAGQFTEAENWFRKALPLASNAQERDDLETEILVQIQSRYESASTSGDYMAEAAERLRFAAELDPVTQADEVLGQKYAAVEAYENARAFQQAIDLLVEISANEDDAERVYAWYYKATGIAGDADKMNDPVQAQNLEKAYIAKHPSSNYAFRLRMKHLNAAFQDPARITEAADGFLQIFEDVQSNSIDPGDAQASSLLNDAILSYMKAGNTTKEYELRNRFISLYPNHENVIPYLEVMAVGYYDRGEMEEYTRLARDIYRRDPNSTIYQQVAQNELARIGTQFSEAWDNQEYEAAFGFRDEYVRVEAAYKNEGLSFQNEAAYELFAAAQKEYDDLQKYQAFLANYDRQIASLKRSDLLTKAPSTHIRVNANTTFDRHLGAGDNRLKRFQTTVQTEVNKVMTLIRQGNESGFYIDNERRIEAIDLIASINERAIEIVSTQLEQYFRTTVEAQFYRDQYPGEQLDALIEHFSAQQTGQYANDMVSWLFTMYRLYHISGYQNEATNAAVAKLTEKGVPMEYRIDEHKLDSNWQQDLQPNGSALSVRNQSSPTGTDLGMLTIPAQKTLRINKTINMSLVPDFAHLHLMYPLDMQIKINGSLVEAEIVPVDTLTADKPATTHYVAILPIESFVEGPNELELEFNNQRSSNQDLAMNLQLRTSLLRIRQNIPPVVTSVHSNQTWRVITVDPETGEERSSSPVAATNWGITWDNIEGFAPSAASPIWVAEDSLQVETLVLETEFDLDSEFQEGQIDFVAPEEVTVYINGNRLSNAIMDYDPDPLMVYAIPLQIPAQMVQMGKNKIRFEISNSSSYRGFLATITIAKAGKEEIR
ncbi:MAG: tetratricopeptide repeat protein [Candidatus Cloacimonadaceae bacterium]|jgi:tetratricopeptide (TPR) repeat protein|nr:tetratricopeptide repeat protein [Candidatus Cloacimonadaceae bacterium]